MMACKSCLISLSMHLLCIVMPIHAQPLQKPSELTIKVTHDPSLGDILTDHSGRTLYIFTFDSPNMSNCDVECSTIWPPVLVSSGKPPQFPNLPGKFDVIKRGDNKFQVTYNEMPLYYYIKDTKPGDTKGQNVDSQWFVVHPEIQYSPPRTGSTLIYNILQYLFEDRSFATIGPPARVQKGHTPPYHSNSVIISTIRHPIQAYASAWKAVIKPSLEDLAFSYCLFMEFCQKNPYITVLKYESFMKDWNVIFDGIELAFSITIPEEEKLRLEELFSLENMKKIAERYNNFSTYDDFTHIHGNHITNENDVSWKEILPEHYHAEVIRVLGPICVSLGYDIEY